MRKMTLQISSLLLLAMTSVSCSSGEKGVSATKDLVPSGPVDYKIDNWIGVRECPVAGESCARAITSTSIDDTLAGALSTLTRRNDGVCFDEVTGANAQGVAVYPCNQRSDSGFIPASGALFFTISNAKTTEIETSPSAPVGWDLTLPCELTLSFNSVDVGATTCRVSAPGNAPVGYVNFRLAELCTGDFASVCDLSFDGTEQQFKLQLKTTHH